MAKRLRTSPPENPVAFTFDGEPYVGDAGDSLAVALWAEGHQSLSRSPKYHRPRGPFCFTGQCEGCLVRVQGTPNTMACQVRLTEGMAASAQNYLGAPSFDLLRLADWMFPTGFNHHEFMAGVPVAEDVMKAMARRIAGLGTLPDSTAPEPIAVRRAVDVLVVGGGLAGRTVAARTGADLIDAASAIAIGVYGAPQREVLVIEPERTVLYAPRALVLATGAHEGLPVFEGNDLPGIVSLRGALALAGRGVKVGHDALVVEVPGGTGLGRAFAAEHGLRHVQGAITEATSGLRITVGGQRYEADAVVLDAPRAPAFELAVQAGALTKPAACGFSVQVDAEGRAADGLWAVGELTGLAFTADVPAERTRAALVEQAERAARSIVH